MNALDLAAFDALGWNVRIDALKNASWTATTAQMAAVPEPSVWAMMLLGFGMIGTAIRRKRRVPAAV
jgi:hypothetical protein